MTDTDPDDFTGIDKNDETDKIDETNQNDEVTEENAIEGETLEEDENHGFFTRVRDGLSGGLDREDLPDGFDRLSGTPSKVSARYSRGDEEIEYEEEAGTTRRGVLKGATAGVAGTLGVGLLADYLSDGELDANLQGTGGIGGAAGPGAVNETENQTPGEQDYEGEIDGSGYELSEVPGPVEGEGFQVSGDVLQQYDSDGWADITDEQEYEDLGTGTEWFVREDAIIGVNEQNRVSRTFPGNEFGYDTQELYDDIAEEAQ